MQITIPNETAFVAIAEFAQSIGCDLITHNANSLEMRPNPQAQALARALDRANQPLKDATTC
jgi:hypothetical protein